MNAATATPILLLTRPERQSKRFLALCTERMGERPQNLISPTMRIEPRLQFVLPDGDQTLIITSENALEALFQRADFTGRRALCVGEATTRSAKGYGLVAECLGRNAKELFEALSERGEKGPFAHIRGAHTTGDLPEKLRIAGLEISEHVVYDQVSQPLSGGAKAILGINRRVVVPLFSPRSTQLFFEAAPDIAADLKVAVISEAAADRLPDDIDPLVASEPTASAMADAVETLFKSS